MAKKTPRGLVTAKNPRKTTPFDLEAYIQEQDRKVPGFAAAVERERVRVSSDDRVRLSRMKRAPTHPGEMLLEEFLKPAGVSLTAAAAVLGMLASQLRAVVRGQRPVTADLALRLEAYTGSSVRFWLNLQTDLDLWRAIKAAGRRKIRPMPDPDVPPELTREMMARAVRVPDGVTDLRPYLMEANRRAKAARAAKAERRRP